MTEVIPFRGIYYNNEKVSGDEVIAPPYDVITPAMLESLYSKSLYNAVRVDFGMKLPGDDEKEKRYARAAGMLEKWQQEGVILKSERPCFYANRIEYEAVGEQKSLTGLFGLVRLVELGSGVYPHEATHSKPKKDRLSLLAGSMANTSPIYSLYRSPGASISPVLQRETASPPHLSATDADGAVHTFWRIEDQSSVESIAKSLAEASVFIADGHHRYETALAFRNDLREKRGSGSVEPWDYVLMFLVEMEDEGITVLPTHRVITVDVEGLEEKLSPHFEVERLAADSDIIEAISGHAHTFGLYAGGQRSILRSRGVALEDVNPAIRELDVVVLHKLIFGRLLEVGSWAYEMDYATTLAKVDEGEYDAAFFLNPTEVRDVERVAREGLRMPPKSTYFYPKVQTGFVMNSLTSF
jgi:uncharacterized protein (DUF1015 family)